MLSALKIGESHRSHMAKATLCAATLCTDLGLTHSILHSLVDSPGLTRARLRQSVEQAWNQRDFSRAGRDATIGAVSKSRQGVSEPGKRPADHETRLSGACRGL